MSNKCFAKVSANSGILGQRFLPAFAQRKSLTGFTLDRQKLGHKMFWAILLQHFLKFCLADVQPISWANEKHRHTLSLLLMHGGHDCSY